MPRSAGFKTRATSEGRYFISGGVLGSGHDHTDRARDAAPVVAERPSDRQVDDNTPNRRLDSRAQLQQPEPQGADLATSAPGPSGLEANLLHLHIGGSSHQHPQLIDQEKRATGAVDLKAELDLLQPVFNVVNGAERCPFFGTLRCPIFCALRYPVSGTMRDSDAGGYPDAALLSSSLTAALMTPALRLLFSR